MLRKVATYMILAISILLMIPGAALAHATVSPKTVNANTYEKFTLRVPTEKESDTVKVRVEVPEGFAVSRVKPVPGWTYQFEKGADGATLRAVVWSGGKIAPGEFQEFEFQGKSAANPGKYAFPVYQTYADGETVAWTGPSDAQKPASIVEVKAAAGAAVDEHGQEKPAAAPAPAATAPTPPAPTPATGGGGGETGTSPLTTVAAYGGLVLGAAALLVALFKR